MMQAVKNCIEDIGIPVEEALRMASAYPIELMNISGRGRIEPGYKADLIVFNKNYEIEHIFIEGVKV
jgi:N-acetylglucosamine-6-phosphate deacetylase